MFNQELNALFTTLTEVVHQNHRFYFFIADYLSLIGSILVVLFFGHLLFLGFFNKKTTKKKQYIHIGLLAFQVLFLFGLFSYPSAKNYSIKEFDNDIVKAQQILKEKQHIAVSNEQIELARKQLFSSNKEQSTDVVPLMLFVK